MSALLLAVLLSIPVDVDGVATAALFRPEGKVRVSAEAQHGFADPQDTWGGYDESAARDSWTRAMALLEKSLAR